MNWIKIFKTKTLLGWGEVESTREKPRESEEDQSERLIKLTQYERLKQCKGKTNTLK